jgi:diguanylate cyclase
MMSTLQNRRILLIDDSPEIHADFRKILAPATPGKGELDAIEAALFSVEPALPATVFELDSACQGQEGLAKVRSSLQRDLPYALAFVDMRMPPGWDGVETIRHLWQADARLQIVICTAFSDHSLEHVCEQLDARDRLLILKKPFDAVEVRQLAGALTVKWQITQNLTRRMAHLEEAVRLRTSELHAANEALRNDIAEIQRKDQRIEYLAFHDALTELPNRELLQDRLRQAIAQARRDTQLLGVLFIDLDGFKAINDSFGHDTGNALLKTVADRLRGCLRASDVVARMGGDEFVVLVRCGENPPHYGMVAQKIIDTLSLPVSLDGHEIQVSGSIGIACYPGDGEGPIELMKHADAAMYAAKAAGRGTYCFFQPEMGDMVLQRLQFEMQLRQAIPNGELELFYQPKVLLDTGTVCGVEALVRWRHPVRGLMLPGEFIALAEAGGIIESLGDWVLQEACRQSHAWQMAGLRVKIAVNVSGRQLQQRGFVQRLVDLTSQYRIVPSDLEIEITESVLMANPQQISDVLTQLRSAGVLVAIDDFGTGYSSLAYLRRLPIDILKIDRSFVMNVDRDEGDAQVAKFIVALGRELKLSIVAEGVETENHAAFLRGCGCDTAQGYLYSRPCPAVDIEPWLRQHGAAETTKK